mmetsp:Transcript_6327/g.10746  ORF Transcript_6327/g.10746 Transcript_6327/m.10746 type:complete len:202 (+) Transcript_6327:291-896(+)
MEGSSFPMNSSATGRLLAKSSFQSRVRSLQLRFHSFLKCSRRVFLTSTRVFALMPIALMFTVSSMEVWVRSCLSCSTALLLLIPRLPATLMLVKPLLAALTPSKMVAMAGDFSSVTLKEMSKISRLDLRPLRKRERNFMPWSSMALWARWSSFRWIPPLFFCWACTSISKDLAPRPQLLALKIWRVLFFWKKSAKDLAPST